VPLVLLFVWLRVRAPDSRTAALDDH